MGESSKTFFAYVLPAELLEISRRRTKSQTGQRLPAEDVQNYEQTIAAEKRLVAEAETTLVLVRSKYPVRRWLHRLWPVAEIQAAENLLRDLCEHCERQATKKAPPVTRQELMGLAFSGGGIRSATFNLGVLQGLADLGILRFFDYLSTVSGGGYIGSWLSAWIWHQRTSPGGGLAAVEKQLKPALVARRPQSTKPDEPEAIFHLRRYSNYLTPRLGFFSQDTWSAIAIYVRNLLLVQLILVPAVAFVLLIPKILAKGYRPDAEQVFLWIALALLVLAVIATLIAIASALNSLTKPQSLHFKLRDLQWRIGIPLAAASVVFCWLFGMQRPGLEQLSFAGRFLLPPFIDESSLSWLWWGLAVGVINVIVFLLCASIHHAESNILRRIFADFVAGAVAGILLYHLLHFGLWPWAERDRAWDVVSWGPPLFLIVFLLAVTVQVGLRGITESDEAREWHASLGAWLLIYALVWAGIFALAFYGPLSWQLLAGWAKTKTTLIMGWVGSTIAAILAGKSPNSGGQGSASKTESVARVSPVIAAIGLLMLISLLSNAIVNVWSTAPSADLPAATAEEIPKSKLVGSARVNSERMTVDLAVQREPAATASYRVTEQRYWNEIKAADINVLLSLSALCFVIALILSLTVDVNEFSLHAFYRNRLVRCYLGASKGDTRNPDWITGFDPHDDFPLARLRPDGGQPVSAYDGPYLIVNTALNQMAGTELAWQQRKASSFVLTPRFSGSQQTGYRETENFCGAAGSGIDLGTAFAISGAAVSPNMGYHSSGPIAFLLTLFNVRVGWWVGNPKKEGKYQNCGPRIGFPYLVTELFGQSNADRGYVYLSDGGHFENLGIYELVRRRCKYIVCCDAGADPLSTFEDLGNAIRKIRADLGVSIEIDGDMIHPQPGQSHSRWHQAIGTIRYDQVDPEESVGMLVYIKASLTGDEPADVLEHAGRHPLFPHDTTADQFFDESQFESYRKLGEHVAWEVFRSSAPAVNQGPDGIFDALRHHWVLVPPSIEESFLHEKEAWIALETKLREDPQLAGYDLEIYPELKRILGANPQSLLVRDPRADLHFCNRQIQLMENVFIALKFQKYHAFALNRGWMNLFRRWASTPTFQQLWPGLRGSFSRRFVDFVEENLFATVNFPIANQVPPYLLTLLLEDFQRDESSSAIAPRFPDALRAPLPLNGAPNRALWMIQPSADSQDAWGIAVVGRRSSRNVFRLYVWVRGGYRNLALGGRVLDEALLVLRRDTRTKGATLVVDLGREEPGSATYKDRKAAWLRFYCQRGFEKYSSDQGRLRLTLQL